VETGQFEGDALVYRFGFRAKAGRENYEIHTCHRPRNIGEAKNS